MHFLNPMYFFNIKLIKLIDSLHKQDTYKMRTCFLLIKSSVLDSVSGHRCSQTGLNFQADPSRSNLTTIGPKRICV